MGGSPEPEERGGWLIVEDEGLVALLIEDAIAELGLKTLGPVSRVAAALLLLEQKHPDGALLDVNLAGEPVFPVAQVLARRGVPFAFITGYGQTGVTPEWSGYPLLQKPFMPGQIQTMVRRLSQRTGDRSRL